MRPADRAHARSLAVALTVCTVAAAAQPINPTSAASAASVPAAAPATAGTAQPAATQPGATQPATTQPATTQPATTQPAATQPADAAQPAGPATLATTRWIGYQEVAGERSMPVLGTLKTLNRNWFLADRTDRPDGGFVLRQHTCAIDFDRVLGVRVKMSQRLVDAMPKADVAFDKLPDGTYGARGWRHGWGTEDLEGDGHPGATVTVDAPLCGGDLYVASDTLTRARAKEHNGGLEARLTVDVKQKVLGASGDCLRSAATDTEERHTGWFRLVPAPRPDTTCADFNRANWPAAPGR